MNFGDSSDDLRREFDNVYRGKTYTTGQFTLGVSPATSTTVNRLGVSTNSVVHLIAHTNAQQSDIIRVIPAKDQFVVTHTASASSNRVFRYTYWTGVFT